MKEVTFQNIIWYKYLETGYNSKTNTIKKCIGRVYIPYSAIVNIEEIQIEAKINKDEKVLLKTIVDLVDGRSFYLTEDIYNVIRVIQEGWSIR